MRHSFLLCISILAATIAASPAPKQTDVYPSGSSVDSPSATDGSEPPCTESHHRKWPHEKEHEKDRKHRSRSKYPYPTMQPTGGYEGPNTDSATPTGPVSQATGGGSPYTGGGPPYTGGGPPYTNGGPPATNGPLPTGSTGDQPTGVDGGPVASGSLTPAASGTAGNGSIVSSGAISAPAGCQVVNGVAVGWLPGTSEKIGDIESALGVTACFDGEYAQITTTGPYTDSNNQLLGSLTQITGGKTVFIASLMPSIAMSSVDSTVAGGVASVMKQFTDKGIEVWLRFAHEMNWYVTDGTYKGTASDFQSAWAAISSAVESNDQVKMFWSPNQASAADIESGGWFPTSGKVDMVGIDIYPKSQQSFGDVYGDFCKTFSTGKNLPFVIGETGAGPDLKQAWLGELAKGDKSACPNYVGFSWFDYNKEEDFQVVEGGSTIAKQVLG